MRLGDAGGNRTDSDFGYEFYRDPCLGVDILQVVNELR